MGAFKSFVIIAVSLLLAGGLNIGAKFEWGYYPAYAYTYFQLRYFMIIVSLFLTVAVLEIIQIIRTKRKKRNYFGLRAIIDILFISMIFCTFFTDNIRLEETKIVQLGGEFLEFSSHEYPLANNSGHGAIALFKLDEKTTLHSVYFHLEKSYGLEKVFPDKNLDKLFAAIHSTNSPHLENVKFETNGFSTHYGSIYSHEGKYVLEFYSSDGMLGNMTPQFLEFIKNNIFEIRKDFNLHIVKPQS